ncbi:bifunctional DNA primase/polymerase [Botrimarina hoheduenensis]|uniref:DNA primase/polymerase bifunctional N-terminal domain-containing protein n=1 Tax=Botrimarina hoheduenensis TaxID=2528000 RepID=A0A5C5VY57_9BACT|nr:bifunctional DNA primase/polymerase [Botrimarina hoheduenensis]TWT42659.1 hypothetical protein Pla111_26310 [Botrimarina hoheduenensis]
MKRELEEARAYVERGWSIIPMRMTEKKPCYRWKRYQRNPASPATLYRWFHATDNGVGVIFGQVSGGLASRDFDDARAYHRWAEAQPALAATLPTVATRRGFHVYANAWPESVEEARRRLRGRPEGTGAIALGDGELRAGVGCYSVLPPSTHPSGHVYGWAVPLPEGELPWIDICEAGFFAAPAVEAAVEVDRFHGCHTGDTVDTVDTSNRGEGEGREKYDSEQRDFTIYVELTVEEAIAGSLPTDGGQRHRQVFEFARRLKAVPDLAELPGRELRQYVQEWHRRAYRAINTKPFEETWIDFLKAWQNVRTPYGGGVLSTAFARACRAGLPEVAQHYEQSEVQLLAGLCRELQRGAGDQPFYLSCRNAGRLLGVDHKQANRWLYLLVADGLLVEVEKGNVKTRKASQYRWRGNSGVA